MELALLDVTDVSISTDFKVVQLHVKDGTTRAFQFAVPARAKNWARYVGAPGTNEAKTQKLTFCFFTRNTPYSHSIAEEEKVKRTVATMALPARVTTPPQTTSETAPPRPPRSATLRQQTRHSRVIALSASPPSLSLFFFCCAIPTRTAACCCAGWPRSTRSACRRSPPATVSVYPEVRQHVYF